MKKWWKNGWKVRNIIVSIHDFSLRTWRCQTYHVCFPSKNKCSKSLDQGTVLPMMMFLEGSKPPATAWRGSQVGVDVPFLSFWGLRCRSILISCEKKDILWYPSRKQACVYSYKIPKNDQKFWRMLAISWPIPKQNESSGNMSSGQKRQPTWPPDGEALQMSIDRARPKLAFRGG